MANTVHGPFTKGASLATGSYGTGVGQVNTYTSGNVNNDETQAGVALASFNPDLITGAFVLSGVACVKDSATANKLNITAGEAYLLMSDGTFARIDVAATSETTSALATTYYLDLNPDGSWGWATSHSGVSHYLPICQVTTDGAGNISTVTDKRVTTAMLLSAVSGGAQLPSPLNVALTQQPLYAASVNTGVTFGQPPLLAGTMSGAALFNGSTGYLTVPTSGLPTGNSAWSLEGWFKTTASANQMIVGMGGTTTKTAALLYVNSSNHLTADLFNASIASAATVNNGAQHHAVATWDGTTLTLYLDGASVASSAALGPDAIAYGTALVGAQNFGSIGNWFNGVLDEVAIYGAALSSTRVTAHYNAGVSTTSDAYVTTVLADAPLRYYRLGEASTTTVANCTISPTAQSLLDAGGNFYGPAGFRLGYNGANTEIELAGPLQGPANGFLFIDWTGSAAAFPFSVGAAGVTGAAHIDNSGNFTGGAISAGGALTQIGGQASTGSFGAPVVVAQALNQHITTTALLNVLSFTPTAAGLYRVSGNVAMGNTVASALTGYVQYHDPHLGINVTQTFDGSIQGNNPVALNSVSVNPAVAFSVIPATIYADTTIAIVCRYQNATATPNDYVSYLIERLA